MILRVFILVQIFFLAHSIMSLNLISSGVITLSAIFLSLGIQMIYIFGDRGDNKKNGIIYLLVGILLISSVIIFEQFFNIK